MIDIYTHIMPERFFAELTKTSPRLGNIGARMRHVKPLHDLDVRFKLMDGAGDDYAQVISLPVPASASATFHGRDVFAPAAAQLASGVSVHDLGEPWHSAVRRRTPEAQKRADGVIEGEVITIDRFGNAITNLYVRGGGWLEAAGSRLPLVRTYAEVATGTCVGVVGSSGLLEVAMRDGDAARSMQLVRGSVIVWHPAD